MSFGENITINSRAPESFVSIAPAFILHTYTTKDIKKLHKRRTYSGLRPPTQELSAASTYRELIL